MTTRLGRDQNPVVITGLACRFPGEARNATSFWDLLCTGQCERALPVT